ncbi:MAG: septal ring lytic transglycosylase RlpA family protein [Pseudomonadales bacterium]
MAGYCSQRWVIFYIVIAVVLLCVACGSNNPNKGRYSVDQDYGPGVELDASKIKDAIPRNDPIRTAGNKSPYEIFGKTYHIMPSAKGYSEKGTASWYGKKFHGHKTSNGEIYDMYAMSAAHKTLPIPSYVRVTNLDNKRSTIVRVNDRGPFHGGRIIDLSYAAATKLGYSSSGTARVKVEAIDATDWQARPEQKPEKEPAPQTSAAAKPWLQTGVYSDYGQAVAIKLQLESVLSQPVFIDTTSAANGERHKVKIGPLVDRDEAESLIAQLLLENMGRAVVVYE